MENRLEQFLRNRVSEEVFPRPLVGARFFSAGNRYLRDVACALSSQFENEVELKLEGVCDEVPAESLMIRLRVFGDTLDLFFSSELVCELSAIALEGQPEKILTELGEQDIATMSYLVAKVLAEEEIFSHQRIYLTGAASNEPLDKGETFLVSFTLRGVRYEVPCGFSKGLLRRVECYGKLQLPRNTLLSEVPSRWNLELFLELPSPYLLLTLAEGDLLPIRDKKPYVTLSQGETSARVELLDGSSVNALRLKCEKTEV